MIQATIRNVSLYVFCLSLLTVGCTSNNSSNRANNPDSQTDAPNQVVATANNENDLSARIEQISQTAQGQVGVTATVLETGESVTLNGDQQFPMQSVYKFPIAMAVLAQVDQGNLKLDQKIRIEASDIVQDSRILEEGSQGMEFDLAELLQYAVSESDSTASDALLRLIGGPQRVTEYLPTGCGFRVEADLES